MSLVNAGTFLVVASLKNRIRRQIIRLKQPRYLLATCFGVLYLYSVFVRRIGTPQGLLPGGSGTVEAFLLGMGVLSILGSWIFGGEEGALAFTDAETQFLFAAPVTRGALMRYKIVRTLLVSVLSAAIMTLFIGRRFSAQPGLFVLGAWLALSSLSLHLTAASLTRATLVRYGLTGLRRRIATVAVMAVSFGVLGYWAAVGSKPPPPEALSFFEIGRYTAALLASPPLTWVLWPARASLEVAFAAHLSDLWPALPVALAVLAAHVGWVLSSDVAFEEASLAASERRAVALRGRNGRRGVLTVRRGKAPFQLAAAGRPEIAILWKNLTALTRVISVRLVLLVILAVVFMASFAIAEGDHYALFSIGFASLAGIGVLFGPQMVNADLRDDLQHLEILRTWPMSGRQIATGEVLAPAGIITAVLWALLAASTGLGLATHAGGFTAAQKIAAGLSAAMLAPALASAGLVVQNGAALIFPTWVATGTQRGVEALGQRLLTLAGNVFVLTVGFFPAALAGTLVGAVLLPAIGVAALPIGAGIATGVLGVELYGALGVVGRAFERMDLSRD